MNFSILEKAIEEKNVNATVIKQQVAEIVKKVDDGEALPMEVFFELKAILEVVNKSMDAIKTQTINESHKYGERFNYKGCYIERYNTMKYDYSSCPHWVELKTAEESYATERKFLEEVMKKEGYVDEETGEVFKSEAKSTETLRYTFQVPRN